MLLFPKERSITLVHVKGKRHYNLVFSSDDSVLYGDSHIEQ
jgi:hypothetical protein